MDEWRGPAGWHPDPTRRFELRWHNGTAWTADVAVHGQRFVDPAGVHGPSPDHDRNGAAIASLVLGLSAITLVWLPFLFALAAVAGMVGAVFGVLALRHRSRVARAMSVWGLCLSLLSLGGIPVGWYFTTSLIDRVEQGLSPGPYEITVDECTAGRYSITFRGSIVNRDTESHQYAVTVHYLVDGDVLTTDTARTDTVAPGTSAEVVTIADRRVDEGDTVECTIADVSGAGLGLP